MESQSGFYKEYLAYLLAAEVVDVNSNKTTEPSALKIAAAHFANRRRGKMFDMAMKIDRISFQAYEKTVTEGVSVQKVLDHCRKIFQDMCKQQAS